jgi:hypothetical protein
MNHKSIMAYRDKYAGEHWDGGPSMDVVRARHRAVIERKCRCGNKRDPSEIKRVGSRTWISCLRCFGQIKQLS